MHRIHPPQCEIEEGCKGDPSEIWQQNEGCRFTDRPEGQQRGQNRKPQRDDDCERKADFAGTEEERRPCGVQYELHQIEP